MKSPLLTVGIPAYNAGPTLRRTLESVLTQTHSNLTVHVNDNASEDETPAICQEFGQLDERVTFTRQESRLEIPDSFRFLIDRAVAPYFAFLAADDWWAPTFAERNLEQLEVDADAVCSVSKVAFVDAVGDRRPALGTFELVQGTRARLRRYLANPEDNSRIFGIYRTSVLQAAFRLMPVSFAHDWLACALTLATGTHRELDETLLFRDETPDASYSRFVERWSDGTLERAIPNLRVTRILLKSLPPGIAISLVPVLLDQNRRAMKHSPYPVSRFFAHATEVAAARLGLISRPR